jgi:transcription antitermination factor NusG
MSWQENAETIQDAPWYALHTRYQHEKAIADVLAVKGIRVLLPSYETIHRWKDRNKRVSLPLFPGYLFCSDAIHRRLQIISTPGVCSILCVAGVPAPIPREEIESIRKAVENPSRVEPHPFLTQGDLVRVTSGSLKGVEGFLIRKKDLFRLVVSVRILGRSAAVEIDASAVERVQSSVSTVFFPHKAPGSAISA